MPQLTSVVAAAGQVGVAQRTIQRWMREGKVRRYRKAGDRRTYVDMQELLRFMEPREI